MAAPIAAAPSAAAATTVFEGFCVEATGFEAEALVLEDIGAADFVVMLGFALTLPEDLAEAGAGATFFAGESDGLDAWFVPDTDFIGFAVTFTCAADCLAGADFDADLAAGLATGFEASFVAGFAAGFAAGLAAGFAEGLAAFFTGPLAEDLEALLLLAGADVFAAGFAELLAAIFDAGFFVCFAIVRLIILS